MADITLTVDYSFSADLHSTVKSIIKNINANPPAIKITLDKKALNNVRQQIKDLAKEAPSINANVGVNTQGNGAGNLSKSLKGVKSAAEDAASGVGTLVREANTYIDNADEASKITKTYKDAVSSVI